MMTIFLLLLMLCSRQRLFAQYPLAGRIIDAETHKPVVDALVVNLQDSVKALSQADGSFQILLPSRHSLPLSISCLGYKSQTILIDSRAVALGRLAQVIALSPDCHNLHDVVVTAHDDARRLRMSAMPVSVISAQQLQGTASSINEVLARTAGITVRNTGGVGSASRISVRGLEGKRMGMFVDGAAMSPMNNYVTINDIPTDMIERIEIYKGIVPYQFGGSALGGAVNVVMKDFPPVYADVGYEVASFNTHRFDAVMKRTDTHSGLQFALGGAYIYAGNDYKMKLVNLDNRIVRRNHDKYRKTMLGGSVKATKWWFDEMKLEWVYINTHQELQGIDTDIREAYNHSASFVSSLDLKKQNFFISGLDLNFSSYYNVGWYGLHDNAKSRWDWDGNRYAPSSPLGGEQNFYASDGRNQSHDFGTKLNLNYVANKYHSFNLNVYLTHTLQLPKDTLMNRSLGYDANFPSHTTSLTTGFSYDLLLFDGKFQSSTTIKNYSYNAHSKMLENYYISHPVRVVTGKNYWGWSEAIRYRFTPKFLVKASYNSEIRIPNNEELVGNGYSILPGTGLLPERTKGINLGVLYHLPKSYGFMEMECNAFCNTLENMIRFTADMIPTMARYRNFGNVRTWGMEAEIKGDVLPWFYFYANGTLQDLRDVRLKLPGTDVDNPTYGKRLPNIPYLMGNAGVELHYANLFGGHGQNSRLMIDLSYIHRYYYDFEMSQYQDRRIPSSLTLDAALEQSFKQRRWTITFKVKNLTDRSVYSELNRPLPGRSFAIKVRYLFK